MPHPATGAALTHAALARCLPFRQRIRPGVGGAPARTRRLQARGTTHDSGTHAGIPIPATRSETQFGRSGSPSPSRARSVRCASWTRARRDPIDSTACRAATSTTRTTSLRPWPRSLPLDAGGVYATLNPVNPALLARAANRLVLTQDRRSRCRCAADSPSPDRCRSGATIGDQCHGGGAPARDCRARCAAQLPRRSGLPGSQP